MTGTDDGTTERDDVALLDRFTGDPERVVWSSDVATDAKTRLDASTTSRSLPRAEFAFRLVNDGDTGLRSNWYGWNLFERTEDGWRHVAPDLTRKPAMMLKPGRSHEWVLTLERDIDQTCEQESGGIGGWQLRVGPVDLGTYAFGIPVERNDGEDDEKAVYAEEFELVG